MTFSIKILDDLKQLDQAQWDALTDHHVYMRYGWLKTIEQTYTNLIEQRYVLLHDNDQLIGATVFHVCRKKDRDWGIDRICFGRLEKYFNLVGISFSPLLMCGPVRGRGEHFLIEKHASTIRRQHILNHLLVALEQEADHHHASLCLSNVLEHEIDLNQILSSRRYFRTSLLPLCYLNIQWHSFEQYRKDSRYISQNMRSNISKHINRNCQEGVIIKTIGQFQEDQESRLYELLNNNSIKHNHIPFQFGTQFLRRLKENLESDAVIYVAEQRAKIIGVSVMLIANGVCHLPFTGVDRGTGRNDYTYFNITYYRPIADAINSNMQALEFGNMMYELKMKRGCTLKRNYLYYRPSKKILRILIKLWFDFLTYWSIRKLPLTVKNNLSSD